MSRDDQTKLVAGIISPACFAGAWALYSRGAWWGWVVIPILIGLVGLFVFCYFTLDERNAAWAAKREKKRNEKRSRDILAAFNDPRAHEAHLLENLICPVTGAEDPLVRKALDELRSSTKKK